MSDEVIQPVESRKDFFRAQRDLAREQISAAWELQVERMHEDLDRGWRDHVARALDERFDALRTAAEEEVERLVAERLAAETERARAWAARQLSEQLNQNVRRLDQAEDLAAWSAALLDGTAALARKVWLFSLLGGKLSLEGTRSNPTPESGPETLPEISLELGTAPAFQNAAESMDTVFSMATSGELSEAILALLPGDEEGAAERRVCLIPIVVGQSEHNRKTAAIVLVDGTAGRPDAPVDVNALEVVSAVAGLSLDARQAAQRVTTSISTMVAPQGVQPVQEASPAKPTTTAPDWQSLEKDDQELHARAQRFARVRVAEMRLYQAEAVRNGREQARLYMALRGEMDRSRAQFKHEYLQSPTMVDYFHLEVLRTLANEDPSLLGPEYPGPLV